VFSIDYISKRNFTGRSIPKFDNIVKSPMFDEDTNILLPQSALKASEFEGKISCLSCSSEYLTVSSNGMAYNF